MLGLSSATANAATRLSHGIVLPPSHVFLEHTGEVRLRVQAGSLDELFAEAGRGLAELQLRGGPMRPAGPGWHQVDLRAADREALLVDWLNELVYYAESALIVPTEFDVLEATATHLKARIRGIPVDQPPSLVKAATLHGARVEVVAGGLEADVVLDI
jgi:SHS2 domain-containing protein